jgi:hypothetical protein
MADTTELRVDLLQIASRLALGEAMTREQHDLLLSKLVTQLCADPQASHTVLALIAITLAKHIEQADG